MIDKVKEGDFASPEEYGYYLMKLKEAKILNVSIYNYL